MDRDNSCEKCLTKAICISKLISVIKRRKYNISTYDIYYAYSDNIKEKCNVLTSYIDELNKLINIEKTVRNIIKNLLNKECKKCINFSLCYNKMLKICNDRLHSENGVNKITIYYCIKLTIPCIYLKVLPIDKIAENLSFSDINDIIEKYTFERKGE